MWWWPTGRSTSVPACGSGRCRPASWEAPSAQADSTTADNAFSYPHGLSTPAAQVAMIAQRYMHLSGATSRDFGAVSVADHKHAAEKPEGVLLPEADHHRGPPDLAVDRRSAAAAGLLPGERRWRGDRDHVAERARDLRQRPADHRSGVAIPFAEQHTMSATPTRTGPAEDGARGRQLWPASGLRRRHRDRDPLRLLHPFTLISARGLGILRQGRSHGLRRRRRLEVGGRLPINTHGGQLGRPTSPE